MKAEQYFTSLMNTKGLRYEFIDDWYDFLVEKQHKVEVNSCQISVKSRGEDGGYQIGRFDFTDEENQNKQLKENVWIALIVRHREQFLFYGFVRAKQIQNARYFSIHQARDLKPIDLDEWVKKINRLSSCSQ